MTYVDKLIPILVLIKDEAEKRHFFGGRVETQYPASSTPSGLALPALFIGRGSQRMGHGTNMEKSSDMYLHFIAFVDEQPYESLEITKARAQADIDEFLTALNKDDTFRTLARQITVEGADAGPMALAKLGYMGGTFPPYGAIRLDAKVDYFYIAI